MTRARGKSGKPLNADALPTREVVLKTVRAGGTRFYMTIILASSIAMAVLCTSSLLFAGVDLIWVRYLVALALAYATFFAGVWAWLHLSPYGRHLRAQREAPGAGSSLDASGLGDIPLPGGGGSGSGPAIRVPIGRGGGFDGGGASASWAEAKVPMVSAAIADRGHALEGAGSGLDGVGDHVGDLVGGVASEEGGFLLVVAVVLLAIALAVLLGAAGFVIYQAPVILGEVVFEVLLGSSLVKGVRSIEPAHWAGVLLRRTWIPFTLLALVALAFAVFAAAFAPEARTATELLQVLTKS